MNIYLAWTKNADIVGAFTTIDAASGAVKLVLEAGLRDGQTLEQVVETQWLIQPDMRQPGDNDVDGAVLRFALDDARYAERLARTLKSIP